MNSSYLLFCITECKQCKNHDLSARCPSTDLTAEIELPDETDGDLSSMILTKRYQRVV
jgi:hypothetical protein